MPKRAGAGRAIPRSIPAGLSAVIEKSAVRVPALFGLIADKGGIPERDMFNTFNMGVGMSVVVAKEDEATALAVLKENGVNAYIVGEIAESDDKVKLV